MSIRSKTGEYILEAVGKISHAPIVHRDRNGDNELYGLNEFVETLKRPTPPHSNHTSPQKPVSSPMNPKRIMGRDPRARPASVLGNPLLAEPKKLIQELSPRAIDADLEALTHEIQKLRKRVTKSFFCNAVI